MPSPKKPSRRSPAKPAAEGIGATDGHDWSRRQLEADLNTHQIELQMQNHELRRAKTGLERSRARYFELFDFAPVGYFTFDDKAQVLNLNLAAAELLQTDRRLAVGSPFTRYLEETSARRFLEHLDQVFRTPGKHTVDLVLLGRNETPRRDLHVVSQLMEGEVDEHPICLTACFDITRRKAAEDEIARLNSELEGRVKQRTSELQESNQDLEAFIYSVSHDLRSPLRSMTGYAELVQLEHSQLLPEDAQLQLGRIVANAARMGCLIDDLLRFSRLVRQPLQLRRSDLNALFEDALLDLRPETQGRNLVWRCDPLPSADCDPGLMRQVLVNLLSNALKYSRRSNPAIISVGVDLHQNEPSIFIRDNGVGFDMSHRDKLFGVFQRLHSPEEFEGNGVGLAMVARILGRHGGRITAEGKRGEGAVFWFTFPGLRAGYTPQRS